MVENLKQIKKVIDEKYPDIKHIVAYLDSESLLETDLSVKAPSHYLS
jgi:hypothetical protein